MSFVDAFSLWWLAVGWQLLLMALVIYGVDRALPQGRAIRLRQALWSLLLLRVVVPPDLVQAEALPTSQLGALPDPAVVAEAGFAWAVALAGVWALGVVVLGWGALRRHRVARRLVAASSCGHGVLAPVLERASAQLGEGRRPPVRLLRGLPGPLLVGVYRPTVLMPADVDPSSPSTLHALLHEWTHAQRRDALAQAAWDVLAVLFWLNPLVWVARRRARMLREAACDLDVVHALGQGAGAYRLSLLRATAQQLFPQAAAYPGLSWRAFGASALERLRTLDHVPRSPRRARGLAVAAFLVAGVFLLPLAARGQALLEQTPFAAPTVEEARAVLDHTLNDRERFGCLQRQAAFLQLVHANRAAQDAGSGAR